MTIDELVQEYIIGLHALTLLNAFMEGRGVGQNKFSSKLSVVTSELTKMDKSNPDLTQLARIALDLAEIFETYAKRSKYEAAVIGRYIEIIGEEWTLFFLEEKYYTHTNKDFFIEQCKSMLIPFLNRTYSSAAGKILSFFDTVVEFIEKTPVLMIPQLKKQCEGLSTQIASLVRYLNLLESIFFRCTLVIYKNAFKHSLDLDNSFTSLFQQGFDLTKEVASRNRLGSAGDNIDPVLWRYMSSDKLMYLLNESAIFFPSVLQLRTTSNDPLEGRHMPFVENIRSEVIDSTPNLLSAVDLTYDLMESAVFINSWYIGTNESKQMWETFIKKGEHGVVIKSTLSKLLKSLNNSKIPITPSIVQYETSKANKLESVDIMSPYFFKSAGYEYESEMRLMAIDLSHLPNGVAGIAIKVSLQDLIDEIILSSLTPDGLEAEYRSLVTKLNLECELTRSNL